MFMHRHLPLAALLCVALGPSGAEEVHDHRQHRAHVHGAASLTLAQEGRQVMLELESPAMNVFGFEHAPGTQRERDIVAQALGTLRHSAKLFAFNADAQCRLQLAEVKAPFDSHPHDDNVGQAHPPATAHTDILAGYSFDCAQPARLHQLRTGFFAAFPATEQIDVQYIVQGRQGAASLDPRHPDLDF